MDGQTEQSAIAAQLERDGYRLDAAAIARIAEQYDRLTQVAGLLMATPLTPGDEPAPVFVPAVPAVSAVPAAPPPGLA